MRTSNSCRQLRHYWYVNLLLFLYCSICYLLNSSTQVAVILQLAPPNMEQKIRCLMSVLAAEHPLNSWKVISTDFFFPVFILLSPCVFLMHFFLKLSLSYSGKQKNTFFFSVGKILPGVDTLCNVDAP